MSLPDIEAAYGAADPRVRGGAHEAKTRPETGLDQVSRQRSDLYRGRYMQTALQFRARNKLLSAALKGTETALWSGFQAVMEKNRGYVRWTIWNGRVAKWGEVG